MIFSINFIILFLNFIINFVLRVFLYENIWIKIFCILITGVIIYVIKYRYPFKRRFRKLSQLRAYKKKDNFLKWALITRKDHILNIIVLSSFVLIFIIGFFVLRFKNIGRDVDLKHIFNLLYNLLHILPNYVIILDLILLINIFIIFIFIMREIRKYVKKEFIKRHLYSLSFSYEYPYNNRYTNFIDGFSTKLQMKIIDIYFYFPEFILKKIYKDFEIRYETDEVFSDKMFLYKRKIRNIIEHILKNIHYYVLFFTFILDIYYNNFHLIYIYIILPITFSYDLFVKYFNFVYQLSRPHDDILKYGIYMFDNIVAMKKGVIYLEHDHGEIGIDLDDLTKAVNVYLEAGLNQQAVRDYEHKQAGRIKYDQKNNHFKQILVIVIIISTLTAGLIYFKINY